MAGLSARPFLSALPLLLLAPVARAQADAWTPVVLGPPTAAVVPAGYADSVFVAGLTSPMSMAFSPFDGRLWVCEQRGTLRIVELDGTLLPTPFVTLTISLGQDAQGATGDGGLFSVAFDPSNASVVYVQYLVPGPNGPGLPWTGDHSRVSRWSVDPADPNVALKGSEFVVFEHSVLTPGTLHHFGGSLVFGTDGLLYSSHGDFFYVNAQNLANSLGKISRVWPNGSIPFSNPFYTTAPSGSKGQAAYIVGLRNPFTSELGTELPFSSPAMLIQDVGESSWEEINYVAGGGFNLGWPLDEGYALTTPPVPTNSPGVYRDPVVAYAHDAMFPGTPSACCITGGALYDLPFGKSFPSTFWGSYFFTDLCGGWIASLPAAVLSQPPGLPRPAPMLFATGYNTPIYIRVGPVDGALYVISNNDATVHRIAWAPNGPPTITEGPQDVTATLGEQATFGISVSSAAALSFQWQSAPPGSSAFSPISGATSVSYTAPPAVVALSGTSVRCVITSADGTAQSQAATLTVLDESAPTAAITAPTLVPCPQCRYSAFSAGSYQGGSNLSFSCAGLDNFVPSGPTAIAASSIAWVVRLLHENHSHPYVGPVSGTSTLTFTAPLMGEYDPVQAYKAWCEATDAHGAVATASAVVYPVVGTLLLLTDPVGQLVLVNGQPKQAPFTFTTVAGMVVNLAPPAGAVFVRWADNSTEDAERFVAVPPLVAAASLTLVLGAVTASPSPSASCGGEVAGRGGAALSASGASALSEAASFVPVLLAVVAAELLRRGLQA